MQDTHTAFKALLAEHRELRKELDSLRRLLDEPRPEVGSEDAPGWGSALAERLVTLHAKTYRHFREEESSGALCALEEAELQDKRTIDSLRADHDLILTGFRSVLDAAMVYAQGGEPDRPNLRQRTISLIEAFKQHEEAETDLMQHLMCDDIGTGD